MPGLIIDSYSRKEATIMEAEHVSGRNVGHTMLYALSTCPWCQKTKKLLGELGVEYFYIDVDDLDGAEKEEVMAEVAKWNPARSFPTLVLDNKKCIVGFREEDIRKVLKK